MDWNEKPLDLHIPGEQPEQEVEADPPLRPGGLCPQCREGRLVYNRMLVLTCDHCGYTDAGGCFT